MNHAFPGLKSKRKAVNTELHRERASLTKIHTKQWRQGQGTLGIERTVSQQIDVLEKMSKTVVRSMTYFCFVFVCFGYLSFVHPSAANPSIVIRNGLSLAGRAEHIPCTM